MEENRWKPDEMYEKWEAKSMSDFPVFKSHQEASAAECFRCHEKRAFLLQRPQPSGYGKGRAAHVLKCIHCHILMYYDLGGDNR